MKQCRQFVRSIALLLVCLSNSGVLAGDLAILTDKNWDEYIPKGKEVDAIYGDFVLRNDQIVVVIANPIVGRNANMTVRDVGGSIIDLTVREHQSDQLSAYYPGARRFPYRLVAIGAEGNISVNVPISTGTNAIGFEAVDGKLKTRATILHGEVVQLQLESPAAPDRPEVRLSYTLRNGSPAVDVRSRYRNTGEKVIKVTLVDDFRADRTFQTHPPGPAELAWFHDKIWAQAYGVVASGAQMRLTGSPVEPRTIEFLTAGQPTVELEPGATVELTRRIFPGRDLVAVKATAARLMGDASARPVGHVLAVSDANGAAVPDVEVSLNSADRFYGVALGGPDGRVVLDLPAGKYSATVTALARGSKDLAIEVAAPSGSGTSPIGLTASLPVAPRVVAEISDPAGKPIPCKVQFVGVDGTKDPNFFDDTGEHAVRNLYYSQNGRFTQIIPPGTYDVFIGYGTEYNLERTRIVAKPNEDAMIKATLKRVVESPGWVSTDYHSHSSPSGDNVSSQYGRVLNLLCEHIEFAPCTEHNRLDTYVPHLRTLGVEHLMATCTGIELTGQPGTINHQNAFPLVLKARTQNNGGPEADPNPEEQIKRLALWDNRSDKLVQTNHPDMGEMFFDKNGDRTPDGGYKGMFEYQDVIEVHPIHDAIQFRPLRYADQVNAKTKEKIKHQYNNSIFNWLQLLNQGRRLPGVVNTDAHYNFHGSGGIRNYVKCQTDDPAKIDPMDMVRASEKGQIIMTTGPYLEVTLHASNATSDSQAGAPRRAIPGEDLVLAGGNGTLHVRVQCPNWFDIDRVQVVLNGRPEKSLNWTRAANPEAFSNAVVKFDRKIPVKLTSDTHVIVVAAGEHSTLGTFLGPTYGTQRPTAISNPIFVDVDGGGFKANGDTLDHPLPLKEQRPVPTEK